MRMLKMNTELDYKWVNQFLGPDESVLWKGTPLKTHLIGKKDGYMIPFSIVWFSFAVFWEANVISGAIKNGTWILSPFALFGMAFVVLGLYITVGRFIHKRILRSKTSCPPSRTSICRNPWSCTSHGTAHTEVPEGTGQSHHRISHDPLWRSVPPPH